MKSNSRRSDSLVRLSRRRIWFFLPLTAGLGALRAAAALYFVAPDGLDTNSGTNLAAPFQSLQRAATNMVAGDTCLIREGVYRQTLAPAQSGTSAQPITFAAFGEEVVTISGADVVTGWKPQANGIYAAPVGGDLGNGYNQVFVDGAMVHQARDPDFGGGDLLHPATVGISVSGSQITGAAWSGHPDNYWVGAWFCGGVNERWSWQTARVTSSFGSTITVDSATQSNPWFQGSGTGFLWGLPSLLDGDNEWHLQAQPPTNTLFLRISGKGDPALHTIEMKRRNWCVDLNGRSYITVRGLKLRAGAVRLKGTGNLLEDCQARFLSHYLKYVWGYSFYGDHAEGAGVLIDGTNNTVRGCTLFDTAGSGIISSGSKNTITRNSIYNTDYSGGYACCLRLNGVQDQVTFNTAHHSGRDIVQPGGAGHSICFNDFHHPGQMCMDLGVIYIWGINAQCPDGSRTRISYNWIHDHAPSGPAPLIYLDNWCRNFMVDHNVCWNGAGDAGIRVNRPAASHEIYDNTLFNCDDLGTHTYDSWPGNNPDPAFWTWDRYDYSALNNLFLGASPQAQLVDWGNRNFQLLPNSVAVNSGVVILGCTDEFAQWGAPDRGAYELGGWVWKAGLAAWCLPQLRACPTRAGGLTLTAPPEAAPFQLMCATNLTTPVVWTPVSVAPVISSTQWSLTVPVSSEGGRFYRLQAR